jgi:hypothetical protein
VSVNVVDYKQTERESKQAFGFKNVKNKIHFLVELLI